MGKFHILHWEIQGALTLFSIDLIFQTYAHNFQAWYLNSNGSASPPSPKTELTSGLPCLCSRSVSCWNSLHHLSTQTLKGLPPPILLLHPCIHQLHHWQKSGSSQGWFHYIFMASKFIWALAPTSKTLTCPWSIPSSILCNNYSKCLPFSFYPLDFFLSVDDLTSFFISEAEVMKCDLPQDSVLGIMKFPHLTGGKTIPDILLMQGIILTNPLENFSWLHSFPTILAPNSLFLNTWGEPSADFWCFISV